MEKEAAVAQIKSKSHNIHSAVDQAQQEGFPTGVNEMEQYFMEQVQEGETLAADREHSPHTERRTFISETIPC